MFARDAAERFVSRHDRFPSHVAERAQLSAVACRSRVSNRADAMGQSLFGDDAIGVGDGGMVLPSGGGGVSGVEPDRFS